VAELHSTLRPNIIQRQGRCRKVAPEEYLKRVAGWNDFLATAALSVVVDDELAKHNITQARAGRVWVRKQHYETYYGREGYGSENNITKLIKDLAKCYNPPPFAEDIEEITVQTTVETLIGASEN
jgi:hypothetical protein